MKNQSVKGLALLAVTGTVFTGCTLLKDLNYVVTPSPLEMHGDSVRIKVEATFPVKGLSKKASVEITPMFGDAALRTVTIQGEKVSGNGSIIPFNDGGKYVYEDFLAYKPAFENAELTVTGKVYKGGKEKPGKFKDKKIADGTIITPLLVNNDYKVILTKDEFKRVTEETIVAQINFDRGQSVVKPGELAEKDMADYAKWLADAVKNPKITLQSVSIVGYASPEGEENKNNTLSIDRSAAAKAAIMGIAQKVQNTKAQTITFDLNGKGEDYDGFKKELKASGMNEDEKNLVIRVLEMHQDPVNREKEMRNMGKTFTYLDDNIFPKLRRSEIVTKYELLGYTDEELKAMALSNPKPLRVEELLYAATLHEDMNSQLKIYETIATQFPNDFRGHNNAGVIYFMQNKLPEAKAAFEKANAVKDNPISKNNLAAVAGKSGDLAKAKQLLAQAKGAGPEVGYNNAVSLIREGKYSDAIAGIGSENCFNKALAQILNGAPADAIKTIDASKDKESAQGFYLKAIASARQDNADAAASNLKNAIAKDASYKDKAAKDREFLKFAENATFTGVIK